MTKWVKGSALLDCLGREKKKFCLSLLFYEKLIFVRKAKPNLTLLLERFLR